MRMTVVVDDRLVIINGEPREIAGLADLCPPNLHALQWYTTHGEEEYRNLTNRVITDLADYVGVIDAFNAAADGEPA